MKKLLAVAALAAACILPASAARIDKGTIEVGGEAYLDFDSAYGTAFNLDLLGGYFVADGWLVGGEFLLYRNDSYTSYGLAATVEKNFEIGKPNRASFWIPYVGGKLGFLGASFDDYEDADNTAFLLGIKGGAKLMLTPSLAVDFGLHLDFASDDVFMDDDGPCSTDIQLRVGLRTFLF